MKKNLLQTLLPGLFLVGYNIGTGSVTSMAKAGANFGLDLLWTVLLSCVAMYYLILLFSRYSMATGETVLYGIRKRIHPALAVLLILLLSPIILAALMGVLGIVAESLFVWSGISAKFWAVGLAVFCYALLWNGRFDFFQNLLVVLVAAMGVAFLWTAIMYFPPLSELLRGFIPKTPNDLPGSNTSALATTAGMIGTTVSVFALLIRSGSVIHAGWKMSDMREQRRDARVSAGLMFVLSMAIIITASATLHARGLPMNSIAEMVHLMEPIAGSIATTVFVVGIVAAGISSHLPNLLVIPWLIQDYRGEPRETNSRFYRGFLFFLSVFSVLGTIFGINPIRLMILSQACIAVALPLTLFLVVYLTSSRKIMGGHVNGYVDYLALAFIVPFTVLMGTLGIQGVFNTIFS